MDLLKALELCRSYAQNNAKKYHPQENFVATGGCFEHNTYRVTALGLLKKKHMILSFDTFRLATLKHFLYNNTATVEWRSLYKLF